jgi:tetratricopeptide (TPR) repeat protein
MSAAPAIATAPAPLLSICMIVKNEEQNLARALASAAGLDAELLVVDTGSTDGTVEVALRAGARVVHFPWVDDFSAARNFGLASARGRWLLVLDADEELSGDLRARIGAILEASEAGAVRIPVSNVDDRGALRMRAPSVRIVRSGRGFAYEGRVHESLEPSLGRAAAAIEDADLAIIHHGYTQTEDARKQRHERNMRLVLAAHEAAPNEPRHWHYLGLQHAIVGEHEAAARWFERVIAERPDHELAGWSASQLASIRLAERAIGAAWEAARAGTGAGLGRVASLLTLGEITLRDGDTLAALECASALAKLPAQRVSGDCERRREATTVLQARAMAAGGNARQAYGVLVRAAKAQPSDAGLADELVKMGERLDTSGRANVTAAKDAQGAKAVIAAGIGTFVRWRAFAHAVQLGESQGVTNEYLAQALWRVGRVEEARALLASFGETAAAQLLICALEPGEESATDEAALAMALGWMPRAAGAAVECVAAGRRVPHELGWLVLRWMEVAIAFRSDAVAERLARSLPAAASESRATHALLCYEGGEPMAALTIALSYAEEPDAWEVIGLVAHDSGDMAAAAAMLSRRARAGDVSVRVALRGASALVAVGDRLGAERLMDLGRSSRPHAVSLRRR